MKKKERKKEGRKVVEVVCDRIDFLPKKLVYSLWKCQVYTNG